MTLADIASDCAGVLSPPEAGAVVARGAAIDARRLRRGEVFVALPGEARDGHDYLPQAAEAGAAAALVTRRTPAAALPRIVVADGRQALTDWAAAVRRRFGGVVVAVTGSNGKTTVKEMLLAVCRAHYGEEAAVGSAGNFNNALGAPLTLLSLRDSHQALVAEAGMDSAGELTRLSSLLRPHVAVINNAQRAHWGNFGSLAAIARAKGEILSGLPADGAAVLNADDPHFALWRQLAGQRKIVSFGFGAMAMVRGAVRADGALAVGDLVIRLRVPGAHNRLNALAAAAAARVLGASEKAIIAGLESFAGVDGRLRLSRLPGGALILDDSYNANPDSTAAALTTLRQMAAAEGGGAVLAMGDMAALGEAALAEHRAVVAACEGGDVRLFAHGEMFGAALGAGDGRHFADKAALIAAVRAAMRAEKLCVLVKGSRMMRMEEVARALALEGAA